MSNQELIEEVFVNLIFAQINDVLVNLIRGVWFVRKVCHKSHIMFLSVTNVNSMAII
jgi:hypothetical protein